MRYNAVKCTLMKLFENIMKRNLRKQVEPTYSPELFGFRKGRTTLGRLITVKQIIYKVVSKAR